MFIITNNRNFLFISLSNFHTALATHLEVNTTKLTDSMYVIHGSGRNVILSIGNDEVILVDDQYAPVTEKMNSVIANITNKPIKFVINTHWHSDHVGGNERLGEAGAIIVSHENVRKCLSNDQFFELINQAIPALSKKGLPMITFSDNMTFYQNKDEIRIKIHRIMAKEYSLDKEQTIYNDLLDAFRLSKRFNIN
jgi:cyclase